MNDLVVLRVKARCHKFKGVSGILRKSCLKARKAQYVNLRNKCNELWSSYKSRDLNKLETTKLRMLQKMYGKNSEETNEK